MLWTPHSDVRVVSNLGLVGTDSWGTGVPGHASVANSDGAVTEILSASANDQESWGIFIHVYRTNATGTAGQGKLTILIGGATDDVLIPDLICGYVIAGQPGPSYFFPLHVPGGVRLAGVFNSVRTGATARVGVELFGGGVPPFRPGGIVDVLGTEISGSRGLAVTPSESGATATVTEMVASSAYDYFALSPGFQPATDTSVTPATTINIGIGVGASTEERIGTWQYIKNTGEGHAPVGTLIPAFRNVPAGSRISMLASNGDLNDAAYDGHIYAVR